MPKGFFPVQDIGFLSGTDPGASGYSLDEMAVKHRQMDRSPRRGSAVAGVRALRSVRRRNSQTVNPMVGSGSRSQGDEATATVASEFIDRLRPKFAEIPGISSVLRARRTST